jgi:uncharacterized cupredoxin-like copper-binding protein
MATRRQILSASGSFVISAMAWSSAGATTATPEVAGMDDAILVPVELKEWEIDPEQHTFRVGQAYRFDVRNDGKLVHEWVVEPADANDEPLERAAYGDESAVSELEDIPVGSSKSLTWTFTDPGDYRMVCHIEGHMEAGMVFPFTVLESAQVVEVETSEFAVKLGTDSVKAGSPVAFVVHNAGKIEHEVVLEPKGAEDEPFEDDENDEEAEIEDIQPGTRRELIWTFAEPGDVQVVCHIAGHLEAGMIAMLTVTA